MLFSYVFHLLFFVLNSLLSLFLLQALANTAHIFESLVQETVERGEGFKVRLHDNDLPVLEQQLASLQDTFNRSALT